jgi:hypothetical protein
VQGGGYQVGLQDGFGAVAEHLVVAAHARELHRGGLDHGVRSPAGDVGILASGDR